MAMEHAWHLRQQQLAAWHERLWQLHQGPKMPRGLSLSMYV